MAQMMEADVPHVTTPSSLKRQQPPVKDSRPDANIDEPYAVKAPFSKTQVNPKIEKSPKVPSSRIQISQNFQKPEAKYDQLDRSFTTNPLLSKTHTTSNLHELAARKARELSAKQPEPSQKMREQSQVGGVKPSDVFWKNSTTKPDRSFTTNPLLTKTHATSNLHEFVAKKAREVSAKQLEAFQKMGEHSQVRGVKQSDVLWKNSTTKPDRSFSTNLLLSKTYATQNLHELTARKAWELSAKQLEASQKQGEESQVGDKPYDILWKNSPTNSSRVCTQNSASVMPLLSLSRELSAKQSEASQKQGEESQVGDKPNDVVWKNSPTNSSRVCTQKSASVKPPLSLSRPACRILQSEIVGTTNNGPKTVEKSSVEPEEEILNQQDAVLTGLKPFKPRRRSVVHVWPDNVEFDESEEVLTIDGEGNMKKVNDPIQPHDVWFAKGVRYCVTFNEFYHPLKKGGHILVRFIGDVARKERFCPIRETNWHHVNAKYKVDIVKCIREHFVLPDGDAYDEGILKRVGKSVRQYRHYLKKTFFKPTTKNREEIYQAGPSGVPLDSWIHLVDYWYSEKGKEEKNKREPTELVVFKQTHKRKDGSYVEDTVTNEFVLDVDTYIETEVATNPTKPKVQIKNEAFGKLMYGKEIPKRPLGYGFGVKGSDVFGVHGILRKEVVNSGDSNSLALQNMAKVQNMEKIVESLTKDNEKLHSKFNETNLLLSKILEGMSSGIPPVELAHLAKSTLDSQGLGFRTGYRGCVFELEFLTVQLASQLGHRLKNANCKLVKEPKRLPIENKLLLTCTPLQYNLAELWSLLNFILPDIFSSHKEFESWFDLSGKCSNEAAREEIEEKRRLQVVAKLHAILRPFLLRRMKSDVELSLPRKKEIILYASMTEH
ncbi:hypothetical protein RND81_01G098600 [Saponaria officinalis]|uniref:SNF2 N-terminal domain-containing protein n=1 Tax=Saponaria officinalis TaxID=3572 RepID=A0AAW1N6S6_SAPOF